MDEYRRLIAVSLADGSTIPDVPPFINVRAQTRAVATFQRVACLNLTMYRERYTELMTSVAVKILDVNVVAQGGALPTVKAKVALSNGIPFDVRRTCVAIATIDSKENAPPVATEIAPRPVYNPYIPSSFIVEGMASFWESSDNTELKARLPSPEINPLVHGIQPSVEKIAKHRGIIETSRAMTKIGIAAAEAAEAAAASIMAIDSELSSSDI